MCSHTYPKPWGHVYVITYTIICSPAISVTIIFIILREKKWGSWITIWKQFLHIQAPHFVHCSLLTLLVFPLIIVVKFFKQLFQFPLEWNNWKSYSTFRKLKRNSRLVIGLIVWYCTPFCVGLQMSAPVLQLWKRQFHLERNCKWNGTLKTSNYN